MDDDGSLKPLVVYHSNCSDGFCSAWVCRKSLPNAEFFPATHGQEPPNVDGKDVFMVDFSYKRHIIEEMKIKAKSLTILDHHKTAAEELKGIPDCIFDMEKSGASLTWKFFNPNKEMPWIVAYTEDRDLNRYQLPFSYEINAALESYPFDFTFWDNLDKDYPQVLKSHLVSDGRSIIRYQERLIDSIIKHARLMELDEYKVMAANTSCIFSQVANKLAKDQPFGLAWYLREDGKYVHSLRSSEDGVDVSELAKRHGGGGHQHSAGFESKNMVLKAI